MRTSRGRDLGGIGAHPRPRRRAAARSLFVLALCLAGCPEGGLGQVHPELVLSEESLDFGAVPLLNTRELELEVANRGQAWMELDDVEIVGDDAAHFWATGLPDLMEAGGSVTMLVSFRPEEERDYRARLVIGSNDPDHRVVEVGLIGEGSTVGAIEVEPKVLRFGVVGEGEVAVEGFEVRSVGEAPLVIEDVFFDDGTPAAFSAAGSWATPHTLEPGASIRLSVAHAPPEGYAPAPAAVVVRSTDPLRTEVAVALESELNRAPVGVCDDADAIEEPVGAVVVLDGSKSFDPDGDEPISFFWEVARRPLNSVTELVDPETATASLELDVAGTWEVGLTVIDALGTESISPCRVRIRAVPGEDLYIELVWDHPLTDLDLHVLRDGGKLFGDRDCWWGNPGAFGCLHSGDDLAGFGPEWVRLSEPPAGAYEVAVHFAKHNGAREPETEATVRVYERGVLQAEERRVMPSAGLVWRAFTVEWPGGRVRPIDEVGELP